ncbi:hypothetical protein [Paenibacillus jiagnxiensis]
MLSDIPTGRLRETAGNQLRRFRLQAACILTAIVLLYAGITQIRFHGRRHVATLSA